MNLTTIKNTLHGAVSRAGLVLQKNSPEILLGVGVVLVVAGVVVACKQTLKIDDILGEAEELEDKMVRALDSETEDYTDQDYKSDSGKLRIKTAAKLVVNYAPAVLLVGGGLACVLAGYGILKRRHLALVAAYSTLSESFEKYRERVRKDQGDAKDKEYLYGAVEDLKNVDKGTVETDPKNRPGLYPMYFKHGCDSWVNDRDMNLSFLTMVQKCLNDQLLINGHVFLNDALKALDIPPIPEGQLMGWIKREGQVSGSIDLGFFDDCCVPTGKLYTSTDPDILVTFNVESKPIYQYI